MNVEVVFRLIALRHGTAFHAEYIRKRSDRNSVGLDDIWRFDLSQRKSAKKTNFYRTSRSQNLTGQGVGSLLRDRLTVQVELLTLGQNIQLRYKTPHP